MNSFGLFIKKGEDDYSMEYIQAPVEVQNAIRTLISDYCVREEKGPLGTIFEDFMWVYLNYMSHEELYSLYNKYRDKFNGDTYSTEDFKSLLENNILQNKDVIRNVIKNMSIPENHYVVVSEDSIEVIDGETFMDRSVPEVKQAIDNVSWDTLIEELKM